MVINLNDLDMANDFHYPLLRSAYQGYYTGIPGIDRDKEEVNITTEQYIDYMDNWVDMHITIAREFYSDPDIVTRTYLVEDLMYYAENYRI